ncbi:MAG: hypothetical protein JW966_16250 [Anaerolineae bacterium]|nr:hypothetical protein [Anaerolineae bacterium]
MQRIRYTIVRRRFHYVTRAGIVLVLWASAAACSTSESGKPLPTVAEIDQIPTSLFLTENAPPSGFGVVAFDPINANLSDRQGWSYTMSGRFEGTFDVSGDEATGSFKAQVWANEYSEARRVVLEVEGSALSPDDALRRLEGVRLSNDYFIVDTNGQCTTGDEQAAAIADLTAGQIIGGVSRAVPSGFRDTIAQTPVWQYTFSPGSVQLPAVHQDATSRVVLDADLWIAPSLNAVLRYELTLTVEHVRVLWAEEPVSGTLYLFYDLDVLSLGQQPNISVPHGC